MEASAGTAGEPGQPAHGGTGTATLVRAIQALPPKYREVIILYYYQEWKAWEIAQRLHVPVSTVTVRLSRARGLLKERLKGWYYEQE